MLCQQFHEIHIANEAIIWQYASTNMPSSCQLDHACQSETNSLQTWDDEFSKNLNSKKANSSHNIYISQNDLKPLSDTPKDVPLFASLVSHDIETGLKKNQEPLESCGDNHNVSEDTGPLSPFTKCVNHFPVVKQ
jgi:hypothetical protein